MKGIRENKQAIRDYLQNEILRYPPLHHGRHAENLKAFHAVGKYEESVFIMTKFPEGAAPEDQVLSSVIDEVKQALKDAGYKPRMATFPYHDWLWDNVELYLAGCAKGIAIVEDRYRKEMNPNVALEWGWMKGMCKKVLFLAEETFASERADWKGLIRATFSWEDPRKGIREAIAGWLQEQEKL
jgi:hypothetical protein